MLRKSSPPVKVRPPMLEITISIPQPTPETFSKWLAEHPTEMSRALYGKTRSDFWDMIDSGAFLNNDREVLL